jgi:DNA-binding NtrC family response regulator
MGAMETTTASGNEMAVARFGIELPPGGVALSEVERELVRQAMERAEGNQTHAAKLLGIERDALRRRLVKYGLLQHASELGEHPQPA